MKVCIIGAGYVGLVSGACFAEVGNDVVCFDVDPHKIAALNAGDVPIHEPGLDAVIKRSVEAGLGVALVQSIAVECEVAAGNLRALALRSGDVSRAFAYARRRGRELSTTAGAWWNCSTASGQRIHEQWLAEWREPPSSEERTRSDALPHARTTTRISLQRSDTEGAKMLSDCVSSASSASLRCVKQA